MQHRLSHESSHESSQETGAPRIMRRVGMVAMGLLLGGASYLIAVRGEAMVVDLATLGAKVWCF